MGGPPLFSSSQCLVRIQIVREGWDAIPEEKVPEWIGVWWGTVNLEHMEHGGLWIRFLRVLSWSGVWPAPLLSRLGWVGFLRRPHGLLLRPR